jgi:hypothetical protein
MSAVTPINQANRNTGFLPIEGSEWSMEKMRIKPSIAIEEGTALGFEVVANTTTGYLIPMGLENVNGADFYGILKEEVRTTDDDFATAGKIKTVAIARSRNAKAEFEVGGIAL